MLFGHESITEGVTEKIPAFAFTKMHSGTATGASVNDLIPRIAISGGRMTLVSSMKW